MRRRTQGGTPTVDAKPPPTDPTASAPLAAPAQLSTLHKLLLCGLVIVIQCGTDLLLEGVKVAQ